MILFFFWICEWCVVMAHASVQTGETWKSTAVKCLWNRRQHSLGEKYTKNSFSAKVKLACYKSEDVFTHPPPVSFTLVWINEVWFLLTQQKTNKQANQNMSLQTTWEGFLARYRKRRKKLLCSRLVENFKLHLYLSGKIFYMCVLCRIPRIQKHTWLQEDF